MRKLVYVSIALLLAGTVEAEGFCPLDTRGTQGRVTGTAPCNDGRGGPECSGLLEGDNWKDWRNAMRAWMANDGLDSIVRNPTSHGVIQHDMTLCGHGQCATVTAMIAVAGLSINGGISGRIPGFSGGVGISGDMPLHRILGSNAVTGINIIVQMPDDLTMQGWGEGSLTVSQVLSTDYTDVIPQNPAPATECQDNFGAETDYIEIVNDGDPDAPEITWGGGIVSPGFRKVPAPLNHLPRSGSMGSRWVCWATESGVACMRVEFPSFNPYG